MKRFAFNFFVILLLVLMAPFILIGLLGGIIYSSLLNGVQYAVQLFIYLTKSANEFNSSSR